jgi:hypothetical protein
MPSAAPIGEWPPGISMRCPSPISHDCAAHIWQLPIPAAKCARCLQPFPVCVAAGTLHAALTHQRPLYPLEIGTSHCDRIGRARCQSTPRSCPPRTSVESMATVAIGCARA